jgi:hypothetical protein
MILVPGNAEIVHVKIGPIRTFSNWLFSAAQLGRHPRTPQTDGVRCRMKSMNKKALSPGAVHSVPADLRKVLISDPVARAKWEDITPLARNEWVCWVISVKKPETRRQHIERVRTELKEGMRRPCCWPGCPHR